MSNTAPQTAIRRLAPTQPASSLKAHEHFELQSSSPHGKPIKLTKEQYLELERAMQWPEDLAAYDAAHNQFTNIEAVTLLKATASAPPKTFRDSQRSRVYAWEKRAVKELGGCDFTSPDFLTLAECQLFVDTVWQKEQSRLKPTKKSIPLIVRPARHQSRAIAHQNHTISLPKWARSKWIILHELAHHLNRGSSQQASHGPRFVGILLGLAARWLDYRVDQLLALAVEAGVKADSRIVGRYES